MWVLVDLVGVWLWTWEYPYFRFLGMMLVMIGTVAGIIHGWRRLENRGKIAQP